MSFQVNEWKSEQEARLAEARRWREAGDTEIAQTRAKAENEVKAANERRKAALEERDTLQKQLKEVQQTVLELVTSSGEADTRAAEAGVQLESKDGQIAEQKDEIARLLAEATNQGATTACCSILPH